MNCELSRSAEFRDLIRNLLYEYSLTHYTTNCSEFTENLVGEDVQFVENLAKISLVDRYSLTRPADPFDTFCQINSFSTLSPYDEPPQTTQDAVSYLKNATKSRGIARTDKVLDNDDYGPPCPKEPFMPALTRKARENTPRPGHTTQGLPDTHAHLLTTQNIKALEVEPIEEQKTVLEDLLDVKHQIKPEELSAVQSLLRNTAGMMRSRTDYNNKFLQPEYLNDVQLPMPYQPEELFLPIFTKDRQPRSGIEAAKPAAKLCKQGFESFSEMPAIALKKIDISDLEVSVSRQHLVIVDGWETIKSSPPSTSESSHSDEDRIDQLSLPSSPDTDPPLIIEFLQAKMEPIMIPRSRRIGGNSGVQPHILAGKSPSAFLAPLLSPIILESEKTENAESRRQLSPVPSSMVGEADIENEPATAPMGEDTLDAQITALYVGHSLENIILAESIDDKPNMMMDVPDLPGPNVHPPNAMHIPRSGAEFLVPKRADNQQPLKKSALPMHQFLSKAKGISPLSTSLSWVMFTTDNRLPSNEEIIGVDKLLGDKISASDSDAHLQEINALIANLDIGEKERLPRWEDDGPDCFHRLQVHDDFQILQTREERWRLARLEGRLRGVPEEEEDAIENIPEEPPIEDDISDCDERLEDNRPAKRPRLDDKNVSNPDVVPSADFSGCPLPPQVNEDAQMVVAADDAQVMDAPAKFRQASQLDINTDPEDNLAGPDPGFEPREDAMHCDDFADDFDKNKENWAPSTPSLPAIADGVSSDYHTPEHMQHYLVAQYNMDDSMSQCYPDLATGNMEEESFQLLSFGTKQPDYNAQQGEEWISDEDLGDPYDDGIRQAYTVETTKAMGDNAHTESTGQEHDKTQTFESLLKPSAASDLLSAFAGLRARKVSSVPAIPAPQNEPLPDIESEPTRPETTREDVIDQHTLQLPRIIKSASSVHRYMASINFIQKSALVRALSSEECAIELAERPSLVGVDLILDPHSAVIVLSLFTLSARCDAYVERVAQQSWRYSKLLIVFEAYPEQLSKRSCTKCGVDSSGAPSELWAYTPPIIKAIRKFRRDLSVAEACGTKDPKCRVIYAFADTVNEGALFIRFFGDKIEAEDETQGALWGEREWLSAESIEEEEARLADIAGMNHFKASIILCQVTLQEYVDMSAQQRIDAFAPYVGMDTMVSCNAYLDARLQEIYSESNTDEADVAENENGS